MLETAYISHCRNAFWGKHGWFKGRYIEIYLNSKIICSALIRIDVADSRYNLNHKALNDPTGTAHDQ